MMSPISAISSVEMSMDAVMLYSTALALSRETSSSSGLLMARWAASRARFSPAATPVPIRAMPDSDMVVRTSAKSRLIMPSARMTSEMPLTA